MAGCGRREGRLARRPLFKGTMLIRAILPEWAKAEDPLRKKVLEGEYSDEEIKHLNQNLFYNIYYLPNYPSEYTPGVTVEGSHIDRFDYVFVDMDLKDGVYATKNDFLATIDIPPSKVVDSGNGVHVYWRVVDLDAITFLRLSRRLLRKFNTDDSIATIYRLMRWPNTINTKYEDSLTFCECIYDVNTSYTCEQLDLLLPIISNEDEKYCKQHFDKTYNPPSRESVRDEIPPKFGALLRTNEEAKKIWSGQLYVDDRSAGDYRLGHLMFASGFTREEAMSVLVNCAKAMSRTPANRIAYAQNIADKIWTYELDGEEKAELSQSVKQILSKGEKALKGTRFACAEEIDATEHGFRLGQVIGLVAGSGVGKTAMALNMFMWFVDKNPDYVHFFIPLEQPANEIADRWNTLCGSNTNLHDKVHVISNYAEDGSFRHLSFEEIREYLLAFQKKTGKKVGCVVIDHIGALKKKGKDGENQDLMDICHSMKGFAVETNTLLVMQSQTSREKAGIGDIELDKDAAYGTVYFESYCDYLITMWQPLKRCYSMEGCPYVTAFKFCKIRHKNVKKDRIKEDVPYLMTFDPTTSRLSAMTQEEDERVGWWVTQSTNKRKRDKKTDVVAYQSIKWSSDDGESADRSTEDRKNAS